jgi:hypothetical protein
MARTRNGPGSGAASAFWADQANSRGEKPQGDSGAAAKTASGMAHRPNCCDQRDDASTAADGNSTWTSIKASHQANASLTRTVRSTSSEMRAPSKP